MSDPAQQVDSAAREAQEAVLAEERAKAEVIRKLGSQAWRLNNLYWVEDEHGRKVKFRPRWEQRELHNNMHDLNAVLKCRQPGISTYCAILMLDYALFTPNKTCGVVDKTDEDVKRKLEKITFAYDHLDDPDDPTTAAIGALIKATVWRTTDNKKELAFSNGSKIWAGTGMRGGTLQFLWITELGYTSYYNPEKAKEIKKGAFNTVHAGQRIIVESTHEGGKFGEWYAILKLAMEAPATLSPLDWKFHFFSWHKHSAYALPVPEGWTPDKDHAEYFAELAKEGIALSLEQQFWYVKKEASIGGAMKSEFPSTPQEAFEAVIKGAVYGKIISALRAKKRIADFEHDPSLPLYTFWDIGYSDYTAIWLVQPCGRDFCALAYRCSTQQIPAYYAAIVRGWESSYGIPVAMNFLPHDARKKEFGGKSAEDHLRAAGLTNLRVVDRTPDLWASINHTRSLLPRFVFHKTNCGQTWPHDGMDMPSGIQCLEGYHTKEDASSGIIKDVPVHDVHSHGADALRTLAESDAAGLIPGSTRALNLMEKPQVILAGWNGARPAQFGGERKFQVPHVILNR